MKLITEAQRKKLLRNWKDEQGARPPVVKIFCPAGAATWLIHSMDPANEDLLFGLCDPGLGFPELGYVALSELTELRVKVRLGPVSGEIALERDKYFRPTHSLTNYADAAGSCGQITERAEHLETATRPAA